MIVDYFLASGLGMKDGLKSTNDSATELVDSEADMSIMRYQ